MNKIFYLIFIISFLSVGLSAQTDPEPEDCDIFELLPPLVVSFPPQMSLDNPPVPCGFWAGGQGGVYVNQCSPCGRKISDDLCANTPTPTLCELDGFETTTGGFTNDEIGNALPGFCNGAGTIENNFFVGFTAQSNIIELLITSEDCTLNNGLQVAIIETNCVDQVTTMQGNNPCTFLGLFNSQVFQANNLVAGNPYYIMFDGFAGDICNITIEVLDGFEEPEFAITAVPPAQLCPDILNPGEITMGNGPGATVFVNTGGVATTDLTFYWINPSGDVIATNGPISIDGSQVQGGLDGTFFNETGTYTVEIIDNGSCCPVCTSVPLEIADPPPAAAAIISGINGEDRLDCNNEIVLVEGNPMDGSEPAAEQWQAVGPTGDRVPLQANLVSANGRIGEFTIDETVVASVLPGQEFGTLTLVYGFITDVLAPCFGDAAVDIEFDFREPDLDIDTPPNLDCATNPSVILDASDTDFPNGGGTFDWEAPDGSTFTGEMPSVSNTGIYLVTVTDDTNGCTAEGMVEVMGMVDPPSLTAIPDAILNCTNMTTGISVSSVADAGGEPITFEWEGPGGIIPSETDPDLTVTQEGTYTLTATNTTNFCIQSTSFEVTLDMPNITIDPFMPLVITCAESMVTFPAAVVTDDGTGTYSYSWADDMNVVVSTDPVLTESSPGTYTLTVTDMDSGCEFMQTATITADSNLPVIDALPSDLVITCATSMVSATASAVNSDGTAITGVTYQWYEGMDDTGTALVDTDAIEFTSDGTFTVFVTNPNNGCVSNESVTVTMDMDAPDASIAEPGSINCVATMVTLTGSSMETDVSYQWFESADGTGAALGTAATQEVNSAGDYSVVITDNTNGCTMLATETVISDGVDPVPAIAMPDVLTCNNMMTVVLDGTGSTGNGTLSYAWSGPNGTGTDETFDATQIGTYTLVVTDMDNGCDETTTVVVTEDVAVPQGVTATGGVITCDDDMGIMLMGFSSSPNVSYSWTDIGNIVYPEQNPLVTASGTYTLTVTNEDNGCIETATADVISDSNVPTVLFTQTDGTTDILSCENPIKEYLGTSNDPDAILTWTDPMGNPITGNPITIDQSSLPGVYTITGVNPINNCGNSSGFQNSPNFAPPEFTLESETILCAPNDEVQLMGMSTDPNTMVNFEWFSNGVSLGQISNPPVTEGGLYTVIATNQTTGCTMESSLMVEANNEEPMVSAAPNFSLSCRPGEDSYELDGSVTGSGTDPLTYEWTVNNTPIADSANPNPTITEAGLYTLTVTNMVSGCIGTTTVDVTDISQDPLAVAGVQLMLNCETPMVQLDGDSDDPMATYQWTSEMNTVVNEQSPMVSEAGEWTLLVTSDNGCTNTDVATVMSDFAPPEDIMITGDNQLTCTQNETQLVGSTSTMDVQGFEWTLDVNPSFSSLLPTATVGEAGEYTLTVTAGNGCTATETFVVTQDVGLPTATATPQDILTCDLTSTMILATSSAMNSSYEWSGPPGFIDPGTQDIEVSVPGDYTVIVTDEDNQCATSITVTVDPDFDEPEVVTMGTTITCEDVTFSISASADMVTNPTFEWEGPGAFTSTESNPEVIVPGPYSVTVTNPVNGCITVMPVTVDEEGDIPVGMVDADVLLLTCENQMSTLSASSITTGLDITFTGDNTNTTMGDEIMVTEPGLVTVSFFNPTNGCEGFATIMIDQDITEPTISIETPPIIDCSTPEVSLVVTSNEMLSTYEWTGPMGGLVDPTDPSPTATMPGLYEVIVTAEDNGCTSMASIVVMEDMDIPVSVPMASEITCEFPAADLIGDASTMGPSISYEWTNSAGDVISTDMSTTTTEPGEYTLTVINSGNGCTIPATIMVESNIMEPTADAGMDAPFPCAVDFVTLSGSGTGQDNLSYEWFTSTNVSIGTQATIDVMQSGTFTLVVTDSRNGCQNSADVVITPDEDAPVVDILPAATLTCDLTTVTLDASNTTGIGTLQYSWIFDNNGMPAGAGSTIDVSSPGNYTLTVLDDSNGCEASMVVPVDENIVMPQFSLGAPIIDCIAGSTDVTVEGLIATNPTYEWSDPSGSPISTDPSLPGITDPGLYTVIITDGDNGCTRSESINVMADEDIPDANIAAPEMLDCDTEVIQLTGMADAGLSYTWSGPNIISGGNTLTPMVGAAGEYVLSVLDTSNGCEGITMITVAENTDVITAINPDGGNVNCFGPNTGSISIDQNSVIGGTAPYLYSIDGGESFTTQQDFLGLTAGMYDVVVQDANGCEDNVTLTINPAVDLVLDLGENQVIAFGDSLMLNPQTNFDISIAEWSDTLLMGTNPFVGPLNTTSYEIVAFDEDGCIVTDNITIFVEKTRPVYIPTAFSPDGDGINDFFTVYADLDLITNIKSLSIYDRWGEQMYFRDEMTPAEALQDMNGWNGNYRDEEKNPGVYVYHVLVEFADGEEIFYEGDFTLIR